MFWKLEQTTAEFRYDPWSGSLDLATPERGLQIQAPNGSCLSEVFGIAFPKPHLPIAQECYVRQGDLIASYPPRESRKFHVQLDFRLLDSTPEQLLVELWISVQTYLLDNYPIVSLRTPLDTNSLEFYSSNASKILERDGLLSQDCENANASEEGSSIAVASGSFLGDKSLSIALLLHPRDQIDTKWSHNIPEQSVEARLFGHFMEKGVIRRARMRCLISLNPPSQTQLQELYDSFAASPLPLTA